MDKEINIDKPKKCTSREKSVTSELSRVTPNYGNVLEFGGNLCKLKAAKYASLIPLIVLASGKQESSVKEIFDLLKNKPIDEEEIAMLHKVFDKDILGHNARGFTILGTNNLGDTVSVSESVTHYSGIRRPLWFVFSGMGSHWVGMGAALMTIPTFRKAIERCHKVLEPRGVDIIKIISGPDKTIFDNILNAFVGIAAVQIGLTDIFKEMGVEPDYIIGHSLGETGCAYQDGVLSLEETILSTYACGKAILESPLEEGILVSVGLGYREIINICPPQIDVAFRNSFESCTLSGPVDVMRNFMSDLNRRGIFTEEVPSGNVAYHSRYIKDAEPALLHRLREVIKSPKLRSKNWISTSVPSEHWDTENAKYSSPEYHTNNLLGPVCFEEMARKIPNNAVVVEIAPHCMLQSILKRSHPKCTHIALTRRGCQDGVKFLLEGIGKLYEAGYNPKVDILYPKVDFPVSTETPFLSHLVGRAGTETWPTITEKNPNTFKYLCSRHLTISLGDDDYSYVADNIINGVTSIPEAAFLVYVWETLAMNRNVDFRDVSIEFSDLVFSSDVIVTPEINVKLCICINKWNDNFEITHDDIIIASGTANIVEKLDLHDYEEFPSDNFDDIRLKSDDVYQVLNMRGYGYTGRLKSLHSVNLTRNNAFIKWTKNWISYLDSLIQLNIFLRNQRGISKPKFVRYLKINVTEFAIPRYNSINGMDCLNAQVDETLDIARSKGVEICGIVFEDQQMVSEEISDIRDKKFYPYHAEKISMQTALEIVLQIVKENSVTEEINLVKSFVSKEPEIFQNLNSTVDKIPDAKMEIKSISYERSELLRLDSDVTNVFLCENIFDDTETVSKIQGSLTHKDFVLTLENQDHKKKDQTKFNFSILACMSDGKQILYLMRKKYNFEQVSTVYVTSLEINFSWISKVKEELSKADKVVLVSQNISHSGVVGFVQKLNKNGHRNISLLAILDKNTNYDENSEYCKHQLNKNMAINILNKGCWGSYYSASCEKTLNLKNFALKSNRTNNIEELTWVENSPCFNKNNLVQVSFSGLSTYDCENVINNKSIRKSFGMDFSGIDRDGDRIMGLISGGSMASSIEADPDLIWPVPAHWSLEDAATVPLAYTVAFYCLALRYNLQSQQRVLITSGIDAFSQAMISLCLALDCTVFTTITSLQEKSFLLKLFPKLNERNICFADDYSLLSVVLANTQSKNKGCHLVVNNFTGALCKTAMKCVGSLGTFLDLNNHETSFSEAVNIYKNVDLTTIFHSSFIRDKKLIQNYISDGIANGTVIPLPRAVFSPSTVSNAFRIVSMGRNMGRVLVKLRDPVIMNKGFSVTPRLTFNPQDVIIVVCDKKYLAIAITDKLIERGARRIMLHMDTTRVTGYVQFMFISWSQREVSVKLSSENLRSKRGCEPMMKKAMKFGKVRAVFIVLDGNDDANVRNEFRSAYDKMCDVVLNLDEVTRSCASLSYFTIIPPEPSTVGEEYALSVLERVAELRREMRLPALVIRHSVGQFATISNQHEPQKFSTFFSAMEIALRKNFQNVSFSTKQDPVDNHLSKTIEKIFAVQDIEDLDNGTSLQDLNLDRISLNELKVAIKNTCRIDYPLRQIRNMTIGRLKELKNTEVQKTTDFNSGMSVFYKHN